MYLMIIVGARGLGRTALSQLRSDPDHDRVWTTYGFLDGGGSDVLSQGLDLPILGDPLTYEPQPRELFVAAIGDPVSKERYTRELRMKQANFVAIRPQVRIGERSLYGSTFFGLDVHISSDCRIGNLVFIDNRTTVGHDTTIGDFSHIGAHVFIGGDVKVGEMVTVNSGANIARGLSIGDRSVVGLGSVVMRDVPPGSVVIGNPARILSTSTSEVSIDE